MARCRTCVSSAKSETAGSTRGYSVFVQSDDRRAPGDSFRSLKDRADGCQPLSDCLKAINSQKKEKKKKGEAPAVSREDYARIACEQWIDVRAFGQVFSFGKSDESDSMSIGIRGPVSIQPAFSTEPVNVTSTQITKSVNLETKADPDKKARDTMGMKHRVDRGVYVTYGAINVQPAEKTGLSEKDVEALKEALRTLFRNDATSARPDGSMEVVRLVWWEHDCPMGQYSSAKVHRSLRLAAGEDGRPSVAVDETAIPGLRYELIDGE